MKWFQVALLVTIFCSSTIAAVVESDICIYGGTSGGVAAAIQASRMGKKAVIAEFGNHLGGLSSGGLGATDIGNKAAIGGISRQFYVRVAKHYAADSAWTCETRDDYLQRRRSSQTAATDAKTLETMWTFEPHVAED